MEPSLFFLPSLPSFPSFPFSSSFLSSASLSPLFRPFRGGSSPLNPARGLGRAVSVPSGFGPCRPLNGFSAFSAENFASHNCVFRGVNYQPTSLHSNALLTHWPFDITVWYLSDHRCRYGITFYTDILPALAVIK